MSFLTDQAKFALAAKTRLLERRLTITALAARLGFARNTVSMAINHSALPTVREKVAKYLKLEGALK